MKIDERVFPAVFALIAQAELQNGQKEIAAGLPEGLGGIQLQIGVQQAAGIFVGVGQPAARRRGGADKL